MPPTALATTYTDQDSVEDLLSAEGLTLSLDDDGSGAPSTLELVRLTNAINWATSRCNLYLLERYDAADLAANWSVWNWATVLAAWKLRQRRGNPAPASVQAQKEAAEADLKNVKARQLSLDDCQERNDVGPSLSCVRIDGRYPYAQLRVEKRLSRKPPQQSVGGAEQTDFTGEIIGAVEPPIY